ncbi:hypothetical protein TNCV_87501 [Trichonephila clavipes]|nr:hypothetical protein TNCV_87501 [Trichonephila clavipes]
MPKSADIESNATDLEYMVVQDNVVRLHPPWSQQGEAARRSSDMRQARHLPQRWYWDIVVQPIDRSGLTPASRLRRSMGQRARNRNPRLHFPPVRVAAHGKHAGQTQKPVLTFRKTKTKEFYFSNTPKK